MAALFHHNWDNWQNALPRTFPMIKDHVLLERAKHLLEIAEEIKSQLSNDIIQDIITAIPDDWLIDESSAMTPDERRAAYVEFLNTKLAKIDLLAKEAADAK